jgi:hypothetical protein
MPLLSEIKVENNEEEGGFSTGSSSADDKFHSKSLSKNNVKPEKKTLMGCPFFNKEITDP